MNKSHDLKRAETMARESIYDGAQFLGKWNGFDVYEPTFDDDEPRFIGFPQFILCKSGQCRWAEDDTESRKIMHVLYSDEDEEDENE